jgi:putative hemolysin
MKRKERTTAVLTDLANPFLLLLMNGFSRLRSLPSFPARKARLRQMAEEPKRRRRAAGFVFGRGTTSFLSVVQIGVTLNSVLAGAFSGATLAEPWAKSERNFLCRPFCEPLAIALTVVGVTYLSLVIGELAPKRSACLCRNYCRSRRFFNADSGSYRRADRLDSAAFHRPSF